MSKSKGGGHDFAGQATQWLKQGFPAVVLVVGPEGEVGLGDSGKRIIDVAVGAGETDLPLVIAVPKDLSTVL